MRRWPLVLAVLLATPCFAATEVYRWADAQGVVHFSDAPPPKGTPFKIMDVQTGVGHDPAPANPASSTDTAAAGGPSAAKLADAADRVEDTPANRKKLCTTLEENIRLLSSDQPLTVSADSTEPLADEDRAGQLASTQAQFNKYCEK